MMEMCVYLHSPAQPQVTTISIESISFSAMTLTWSSNVKASYNLTLTGSSGGQLRSYSVACVVGTVERSITPLPGFITEGVKVRLYSILVIGDAESQELEVGKDLITCKLILSIKLPWQHIIFKLRHTGNVLI